MYDTEREILLQVRMGNMKPSGEYFVGIAKLEETGFVFQLFFDSPVHIWSAQ